MCQSSCTEAKKGREKTQVVSYLLKKKICVEEPKFSASVHEF